MLNWFKRLFHLHEWEVLAEEKYRIVYPDSGKTHATGNQYDCRCKLCGRIRPFRT